MKKNNILFRYLLFLIGLFIASMGVAFSTKSGLGTSPVSSIPYTVSLMNDMLSFGGWLNLFSVIQISIQVLLLRKKCKPVEIIIQTILAFVYGGLTNLSCYLIRGISADTYPLQFLFMVLSCFILAFGIWVQFMGGVAMLPGEAMNRAISQVTAFKYENIKIFFDVAYIVISCVLAVIFFHHLEGVREGSIIAAIAVGMIIKLYNKIYRKLKRQPS